MHLLLVAMVSRKKAAAKARKAAKEAKAVEEDVQEVGQEQKALEAQMQQLTMDELWGESGAVQECLHGFEVDHEQKRCVAFIEAFRRGYNEEFDSGGKNMVPCFGAGLEATEALKFTDNGMDKVVSRLLCEGAQNILDGDDRQARVEASFALYFEQFIAVYIEKTQPSINWHGVAELQFSDLHTLVKFLRKKIPCNCLDKKYNEVKSMTKMGLCSNLECFRSGKRVARSEMLYCARCGTGYCSPECQRKHWPRHKKACKRVASERAQFDAKQQLL